MARPYRGVDASERLAQRRQRFLEAGLELLGGQTDPDQLTVRAICAQSGLTVRYFYESFTDKDAFVEAVFDTVTAQLATTTQAAVATASPADQNRAGITNLIRTISDDARVGRLLFSQQLSNATLLRLRLKHQGLFIALAGRHIQDALHVGGSNRLAGTTHFVLGGLQQAISAWLAGEVKLGVDQFVDLLVDVLADLNDPGLFRG
ncbi:TetR family transcriptional regulator [Mycolicibacterium chitae]|uniref:Transcriptional regulator n=1 Tax=Mycolicibacterium chitae TaxID=1792 RepID=A0A3S4RGQ6_MYCCI|nr:TetR family transcriptional regulator [Mycolicibacterium chitae]MCV7107020.1 TetR/AcrR family transcriptional regulator [Mycolicibacterium chitae]BBZ01185.1 TetR family transcriptional regulator [Mycolicibacterium chitae]VEG50022.1 transcriptional regulator [Mycolicibacterium chitae]